jgi:hypothetical protein
VLLSLLAMLTYYLIMLAGEQLARAGTIAPFLGAILRGRHKAMGRCGF